MINQVTLYCYHIWKIQSVRIIELGIRRFSTDGRIEMCKVSWNVFDRNSIVYKYTYVLTVIIRKLYFNYCIIVITIIII